MKPSLPLRVQAVAAADLGIAGHHDAANRAGKSSRTTEAQSHGDLKINNLRASGSPWFVVQLQSVTQPSEADFTRRTYFPSTPPVALSGGVTRAFRRRDISASSISIVSEQSVASIVMRSPSRTSAIGPPSCASGVM